MLLIGNNLRLDGIHLRSDELFSVGRYLAPLPFQSWAMLVTVRTLVHLRYFLKAAVLHHFPSGVGAGFLLRGRVYCTEKAPG